MNSCKSIVLKSLLIYLSVFMLIAFASCKKDCNDPSNPDCPNYDPCHQLSPVNAEFTMTEVQAKPYERAPHLDTLMIQTDTVTDPSYVIFEANYPDATEYRWQIGTEANPRYGKRIAIYFNSPGAHNFGTIDIQLSVIGTPNSVCFPNDDGMDTRTKPLTIVPDTQSLLFGQWEGTSTEFPNEVFTITLDTIATNISNELYFFQNFPDGCDNGAHLAISYKGALVSRTDVNWCEYTSDGKQVEFFSAQLKDHNTLQIEYISAVDVISDEPQQFLFTGKRK